MRFFIHLTFLLPVLFAIARADNEDAPVDPRAAIHWVAQEVSFSRILEAVSQRAVRGSVLIRDVAVVDVLKSTTVPHQSVLVDAGLISWVGAATAAPDSPGAFVVEGAGLFLSPGLADMHVHTQSIGDQLMHLATGNTTVREMDGFAWMLRLRHAVQTGHLLAPTAYVAGTIIADRPFGVWTVTVKTDEEARRLVRAQTAQGYDFIKIHNNLAEYLFDAVADQARREGKDLIGHVPRHVSVDHVVHAGGMRTLEHLKGFIDDGSISVSGEDFAAALKGATVWLTPTFYVNWNVGLHGAEARRQLDRPEMRYTPAARRKVWEETANLQPDWRERLSGLLFARFRPPLLRFRTAIPAAMERLLPLHPRWLAGTDSPQYDFQIAGFALLDELLLMEERGIARADVLRAATSEPAIAMRHEKEFGQIKSGMRADLVLLAGDPTKDFAVFHDNRGVMVRGVWLTRTNLDAALEEVARVYAESDDDFALDRAAADKLADDSVALAKRDIVFDPMMLNPAIETLRKSGYASAAAKLATVVTPPSFKLPNVSSN